MISATAPKTQSRKLLGAFFLILAASIWGAACVVGKAVLGVIPPIPLVTIRLFIAALLFGLIAWRRGEGIPRKDWPSLVLVGLLGYPGVLATQFIGTDLTNASLSAIITSSAPVLIGVLAWIFLGETMRWPQWVALGLSLAGIALIGGLPVMQGSGLGILMLVLSAVCMAVYTVFAKFVNGKHSPFLVQTYGLWFGFLGILPFGILCWKPLPPLNAPVIAGVLYLSILSTALAFYLWNLGFTMLASGTGGLFYFFQPVVGVLIALIVGERLAPAQWLGALGILAGIFMAMRADEA